ncbi:hypothetical protein DERF_006769 [Dermatophagoides farinae]|uniref:Uncharacterized protein n=1 Tax=Dermatophagoides farinae TaxID=6954 RepID=A0A922HY00_DERFA|nr:hypothetical protein DERF_006769 [Dermatophagoides farinae]
MNSHMTWPAQAPVQTVHRTRPRATEGLALPPAARFRKQLAVPKASQSQKPRSSKSLVVLRASQFQEPRSTKSLAVPKASRFRILDDLIK